MHWRSLSPQRCDAKKIGVIMLRKQHDDAIVHKRPSLRIPGHSLLP